MQPGPTGPSAYPGGYPQQQPPPAGPRPYPGGPQPYPGDAQQPVQPYSPNIFEPANHATPQPYGQPTYEQAGESPYDVQSPDVDGGPAQYPPQPPLGEGPFLPRPQPGDGTNGRQRKAKPPYSALRGTVAGLCLVLTVLLAVPAVGALWLKQTLISDSGFDSAATKLIDNQDVRDEVSSLIAGQIDNQLPAAVGTPAVQQQIGAAVESVVATPQFRQLWAQGVSEAHHVVTSVLLGKNSSDVSTTDGKQFTVMLATPVDQIVSQLETYGVHLNPSALPQQVPIDLAKVPSSGPAQNAAKTVNSAGWMVPTLTLVLLVLGLAVAVRRIRALILTSLGCMVAGAVLLLTVMLGRSPVVDNADQTSKSLTPAATGAIYDVFTDSLVTSGQILLGVSAGVLVLASVAGVVMRRRDADRRAVSPAM